MHRDREMTAAAPAKLNLYLHVLGRRDDGYHLLDSLIAFASVGDTVAVAAAPELSLTVDGPFAQDVPADGDNLVLQAARALAGATGCSDGAHIRLTKRLPVASGIGGGSADAAATLRALVRLWEVTIAPDALAALALRLGADVPICVHGTPAFVGGIGEFIDPAPTLPAAGLLLVNPRVALPTPAVFKARRAFYSPPGRFDAAPADARALAVLLAARHNDLTEPAAGIVPEISRVLGALGSLPEALLARMSGSGATCFALFADETGAGTAASALQARHPAWWVAAGALLAAAPSVAIGGHPR